MLPIERLHRIREIIQIKKNVKITDLSKELGVSEMTIHRDLKTLVEEGIVIKTFGGVSLAKSIHSQANDMCVYCSRPTQEKIAYRLILSNDKMEVACCAHCGLLRHKQIEQEVIQAICADFLKQTTISAHLAFFVMDTSIDIGCCQPQVITFEWKEHAEKFVKGFGGHIYTFEEAKEVIFQKMKGAPHCHE
ncbi:DeoR family transcriptional regulator [Pseudogracilibacillus sp. SO30301A]|uniref:DeoR family transcriptional regulator n=1 Tax=Pseudogracilibacillus sp. SO30301A TaxID=3098291 RepID=UPI00300E20B8